MRRSRKSKTFSTVSQLKKHERKEMIKKMVEVFSGCLFSAFAFGTIGFNIFILSSAQALFIVQDGFVNSKLNILILGNFLLFFLMSVLYYKFMEEYQDDRN